MSNLGAKRSFLCSASRRCLDQVLAEGWPFDSDVNGEAGDNNCTKDYGCGLLKRIDRVKSRQNHCDTPNNICNKECNSQCRCSPFHRQNKQSGSCVEGANSGTCINGSRDLCCRYAEEIMSEACLYLRKPKGNHQHSSHDNAPLALPVHRVPHREASGRSFSKSTFSLKE